VGYTDLTRCRWQCGSILH